MLHDYELDDHEKEHWRNVLEEIFRRHEDNDVHAVHVIVAWFAWTFGCIDAVEGSSDYEQSAEALFGTEDDRAAHPVQPFLVGDLIEWLQTNPERPITGWQMQDAEWAVRRRGVSMQQTDRLIRKLSRDGSCDLDEIPTANRPIFLRRVKRLRPVKEPAPFVRWSQMTSAIEETQKRGVSADQIKALRNRWTRGKSVLTMNLKQGQAFIEKLADLQPEPEAA